MMPNQAPAPNRRPVLPLAGPRGLEHPVCSSPAFPAAVGEAQR